MRIPRIKQYIYKVTYGATSEPSINFPLNSQVRSVLIRSFFWSVFFWSVFFSEKTPYLDTFHVFSPNTGKYGPEKTPYLDTFQAVNLAFLMIICAMKKKSFSKQALNSLI